MSLRAEITEHVFLKLGSVYALIGVATWGDLQAAAAFVASCLAALLSALLIADFVIRRIWRPRKDKP